MLLTEDIQNQQDHLSEKSPCDTWLPFPKQRIALERTEFEVLIGGARGGGKTECGIAWMLYDIKNPLYRGLVIRKNHDDLTGWIDRAKRMYSRHGVVVKGQSSVLHFPYGSVIYTGHLKDENAYTKYQGNEYQRMLIEELTQIPSERLYLQLLASCRSTVKGLAPRVFASTNPGGKGGAWVKRRFVDPAKPGTSFKDKVSGRSRIFIPATIDDNAAIKKENPDYVKMLESLPEDLKAQWRYGSWESTKFKGKIYADEMAQAWKSGRIFEFSHNAHKQVDVAFDLGTADTQCLTFAQDYNIIDFEQANNKDWNYYSTLLKEKGYKYRLFILPHDGSKRNPKDLQSFREFLLEEFPKVPVRTIERTKNIFSDLQTCRTEFAKLSFLKSKTVELIDALDAYRYEEDEKNQVLKDVPKHDWASHPADSLRCLLMCTDRVSTEDADEQYEKELQGLIRDCHNDYND